jgi:hypothetical protein
VLAPRWLRGNAVGSDAARDARRPRGRRDHRSPIRGCAGCSAFPACEADDHLTKASSWLNCERRTFAMPDRSGKNTRTDPGSAGTCPTRLRRNRGRPKRPQTHPLQLAIQMGFVTGRDFQPLCRMLLHCVAVLKFRIRPVVAHGPESRCPASTAPHCHPPLDKFQRRAIAS